MARTQAFTIQQFMDAIKGEGIHDGKGSSGGIKRVVAQRLRCHRDTVVAYEHRYATIKKAMVSESETMIDLAERGLHTAVANGNLTGIIFLLKTLGKDRGYIERVQIEEYVEEALDEMMGVLEERLAPDEFRKIAGVLASADSSPRR